MGKLARQPRLFDQVLVLANGATINVRTTVPKKVVKLATDPTVHPAWNPDSNKGALDQTGQVSRFLRRFEGFYEQDERTGGGGRGGDSEPAAVEAVVEAVAGDGAAKPAKGKGSEKPAAAKAAKPTAAAPAAAAKAAPAAAAPAKKK